MVVPLVAYAAAALAGVAGGSIASNALSSKGTSTSTSTSETITDSRAFNIQYPTYQVQIDSPLASQSTTKKAAATTEATTRTDTGATAGGGLDIASLLPIAAILGLAIIGKELIK